MSCNFPNHMACIDLKDINLRDYPRLRSQGWKFSEDYTKAYRLLPKPKEGDTYKALSCPYAYEVFEIPCGNCISCRLDYSKDWANRCTLEASYHQFNYFVTLTYDDDNIVKGSIGNATLEKDAISHFVRMLRQKFKRLGIACKIKVFACGEYGTQTLRPHYHAILFDCPIPDLSVDFPDDEGHITHHFDSRHVPYMYSKILADLWNKGNILIAEANWNTNAYVSQYILKKQKGDNAKAYDELGILPPFVRMSKNLGLNYFNENGRKMIVNPSLIVGREHKKPLISGLPRYYKKKIKQLLPDCYEQYLDTCKDMIKADLSCQNFNLDRHRHAKDSKLKARNSLNRSAV